MKSTAPQRGLLSVSDTHGVLKAILGLVGSGLCKTTPKLEMALTFHLFRVPSYRRLG